MNAQLSTSPGRKTIIIGGVAGGMSTATRLRRLDEHAEIVVLERGGSVSFANCGFPYHIGGVIAEREKLVLQTPLGMARRFALDVRVRTEVVSIDRDSRSVIVRDLVTGREYSERYDSLVISTGARPAELIAPGADRAHALRDLDDLDRIMAVVNGTANGTGAGSAVVIGAGYIGLEVAENLHARGLHITLVQRGDQVLASLDPEMAWPVAEGLRAAGVDLRLGTRVVELTDDTAILDDGSIVPADLVIAAIGVQPDAALARAAGLTIGATGGIAVDDHQRTSDPAIFAVGDVAEKRDAVTGEARLVPLAGLANRHGRLVADAIAGIPAPSRPAIGTAIISVLGTTVASVGRTERELRAAGIDPRVIHTHPSDHAGYYPGANPMSIKLLVDQESDLILGAQAVGTTGVDKRIDVLAMAMTTGLTASSLADVELAYSPQFGSAKDPVNILGYLARNRAEGSERTVQWHELEDELERGAVLLDVRAPGQLAEGTIPGSIHIPVEELREALATLPDGPVIVQCRVGQGAHTAASILSQNGRSVRNLDGGYLTWRAGQGALAHSSGLRVGTR